MKKMRGMKVVMLEGEERLKKTRLEMEHAVQKADEVGEVPESCSYTSAQYTKLSNYTSTQYTQIVWLH